MVSNIDSTAAIEGLLILIGAQSVQIPKADSV
jgi:hypothetical protein